MVGRRQRYSRSKPFALVATDAFRFGVVLVTQSFRSASPLLLGLSIATLAGCSGSGAATGVTPALAVTNGVASSASAPSAAAPVVSGDPTMPPVVTLAAARPLSTSGGSSLFADNFSADPVGGAVANWTSFFGRWSVCTPAGEARSYCSNANDGGAFAGSSTWTDYTLQATLASSNLRNAGVALLARMQDSSHFYQLELRPDFRTGAPSWWIWKYSAGSWTYVAGGLLGSNSTAVYAMRFDLTGSQLSAYVQYAGTATWTSLGSGKDGSYTSGKIGLRNWGAPGRFSAVSVISSGTATATVAASPSPAPTPTPNASLPKVQALSAGSFVANEGVNVHTGYYGTAYTNSAATYESLATGLGVGVLRDGGWAGDPYVCGVHQTLAAAGLKFAFGSEISPSASSLATTIACVGRNAIKSIEGANEYDISHPSSDTNWPATLRASQQALFAQVQQQLPGVDVIAPSVTSVGAAQAVGDLSAYSTKGNDHVYVGGNRNPGTAPYGGNGYGSLAYDLSVGASVSGSQPVVATEVGFNGVGSGGSGNLSLATQAKYVGRSMLLMAHSGVPTYYYELLDDRIDGFSADALVDSSYTPKPAYYAMKSILGLLTDGGNASATGSLGYAFSGSTSNVQSVLLQKANGTYYLAFWIEAQSAATDSGTEVVVPSQQVTLALATAMTGSLYTHNSSWGFASTSLGTASSMLLTATDAVQFVALH